MMNVMIYGEATFPPAPIIEHAMDPEMEEVGRPELGIDIESSKLHTR